MTCKWSNFVLPPCIFHFLPFSILISINVLIIFFLNMQVIVTIHCNILTTARNADKNSSQLLGITTCWYYWQFIVCRQTKINLSTVCHKCDFAACMRFLFIIFMNVFQHCVKLERFSLTEMERSPRSHFCWQEQHAEQMESGSNSFFYFLNVSLWLTVWSLRTKLPLLIWNHVQPILLQDETKRNFQNVVVCDSKACISLVVSFLFFCLIPPKPKMAIETA